EQGGQLTEMVRRKPYSVVLLDEIEKAHTEVINILLQVIEDGRLTDSKGRVVDLRNTVLIMKSNVGASEVERNKYVGCNSEEEGQEYKDMKEKVTDEVKKAFRPELLNRIDETIVVHALEEKHMKEIVVLMSEQLKERLEEREIYLSLTDKAVEKIAEVGFEPEYGARPLRRSIQKNIEDLLSEALLKGTIVEGDQVKVGLNNKGEFIIL